MTAQYFLIAVSSEDDLNMYYERTYFASDSTVSFGLPLVFNLGLKRK